MNILEIMEIGSFWTGTLVFLGFSLLIGGIAAFLGIFGIFSPKRVFSEGESISIGETACISFFCLMMSYFSFAGFYHWYLGSLNRFTYSLIGYVFYTMIAYVLIGKIGKKLLA
jgi:hypothetical protein